MPDNTLQLIQLRPGVNREGTSYSGEGGFYSCDKIRFRSGLPEKLGGWVQYAQSTYEGVCRHFVEWVSLSDYYLLGVGTNLKYYILTGGVYYNITPIRATFALPSNPIYTLYSTLTSAVSATATVLPTASITANNFDYAAPFVVQIGTELIYVPAVDPTGNTLGTAAYPCTRGYNNTPAAAHSSGAVVSSSMVVVHSPNNGAGVGDFVTLSGATGPVGGIPATALDAEFSVFATSANYVVVDTGVKSTSAASGGGSAITAAYQIPVGAAFTQYLHGWGAGPWPGDPAGNFNHPWNYPYTGGFESILRQWNAANYGQDLYFNLRNGPIFFWSASQNLTSYGSVTGPGVDITNQSVAGITLDQIEVGNFYMISSLGTTTQDQWNDLAQTTGLTYDVGSTFNCQQVIASGYGTGVVWDPATPSVTADVIATDERHIVAFGCNDAVTESADPVEAGSFVLGDTYLINFVGTTDFTLIGASSNAVGVTFVATGVGIGTGTAISIIQDPMFIAWCSQEAPQVWYPTVTNQAGSYRLTYGSKIVCADKTRQEILVWTDTALYSMQYLGAPYVYGFNPVAVNITIVSQNAQTTATGITYWMGQDKFYAYSGRVDTLPCALRQYVFDDINTDQWDQVYAGTNEKYNEIWWFYPSSQSLICDRYVVYNYLEKVWYYGQLSRTAWLDSHIIGNPLGCSAQYDVENLIVGDSYIISYVGDTDWTTVGAPVSAQGQAFIATAQGVGTGYAVQTVGVVVEHETGCDDGSVNPPVPIYAYIESSDFDIGDGGYRFSFVKRIIPDMDFIGSVSTDPSVVMTLTARNYPGDPFPGSDPMQNAPAVINGQDYSVQVYGYTEQVWVRLRGRQLIFRVESSDLGVKWQLGTPRLQIQPDGRR